MAYTSTYRPRRRRTSYYRRRIGRRYPRRYATKRYSRRRVPSDLVSTFFRIQTTHTYLSGQFNGGAAAFKLSDVTANEVTSYRNLYDGYRIKRIRIDVMPRGTSVEQDVAAAVAGHVNYWAVDTTDASKPTAVNDVIQYQRVKYVRGTEILSFSFVPKIAAAVAQSTSAWGYLQSGGWIDSSYPDVMHFGVKWANQIGGSAGSNFYVDVVTTLYVDFKGRR